MTDEQIFCYEQPLNERIRTFLRLEHLLARLRYHQADTSAWGRRATMAALLDILNAMTHHDTRIQISKELGQRYTGLAQLADHETVNTQALQHILDELDTLGHEIQRIPPQFASYQLRNNALLNSLNNRLPIPGGSCGFDLPGYQHWLAQGAERTGRDIDAWCERILPFERAVTRVLQLLRESVPPQRVSADDGVLVQHTDPTSQLIRVILDTPDYYPEISAGPHRATIRFMAYDDDTLHVRQARTSIVFHMACCRY